MKKKMLGIFISILLIAVPVSSLAETMDDKAKQTISRISIIDSWIEQAKLTALDGAAGDWFGCSISIDGDYAIVGACYDDLEKGSAYIFKRNGATWVQEAKLNVSHGKESDRFGCSVSIDGNYALVGAYAKNNWTGAAYVFKRNDTNWAEKAKLTASDGSSGDYFGYSVSIDGSRVIVGASHDDYLGNDSGSAYIFRGHNQAPNVPIITGPSAGTAGEKYEYFFKATDPEGDEIAEYIVNWGDNNQENITGPFISGVLVNASHTWYQKGNFTIKVKAKDVVGAESIWGYLEITMPRNRIAHNSLFLQFLERFPNMFPILRYLLGL